MAEVKLTKNELRAQQTLLGQLNRYLPTLRLKKAMLQSEVNEARMEIVKLQRAFNEQRDRVEAFSALFADRLGFDLREAARIERVHKRYENIAGVDVPYFESVDFVPLTYSLFESPPWVDAAVQGIHRMCEGQVRVTVVEEKKAALEKELREVSIRVNLFEKVLIPRCIRNIKKIKVFLGDQQLAAVGQAKVAKNKIELKKLQKAEALLQGQV
ncbi:MAG: V-type ATP synthase subunit D [Chlamydiia bacterium]|nr:V-type ATP synthase subunit D [Chlamydiia bacterium]